jgi:hypothetical protein
LGFLSNAYEHKYETAAQYLNTRLRGRDAASLAEQVLVVLDWKLPAKLNNLSNDPQGSMSDPLEPRRELIGTCAGKCPVGRRWILSRAEVHHDLAIGLLSKRGVRYFWIESIVQGKNARSCSGPVG